MKKLLFLLLLLPVFSLAQKTTPGNYTYIAQKYEWDAGVFKALGIPAGPGPAAFTAGQVPRAGAIYYDSSGVDAGPKIFNGLAWVDFGGGVSQSALDDTAAAIRGDFPVTPTLQTVTDAGKTSTNDISLTGKNISIGYALRLRNDDTPLIIENDLNNSTQEMPTLFMLRTVNGGNGANGLTQRIDYAMENNAGSTFSSGSINHILTDATAGSLDAQYDIKGVENSVSKILMNIQAAGIIRVNNNADTLATKAYARSVGGGGGSVSGVDTIYRTVGVDSIYYEKDGNTYAIKDSSGGNLVVDSIGTTGLDLIRTQNNIIYHRLLTGENGIDIDSLPTGEAVVRADTAAILASKAYVADQIAGLSGSATIAEGWFADTLTVSSDETIIRRADIWEDFYTSPNSTAGSSFTFEAVSGTGADASIGNTTGTTPDDRGWLVFQTGSTNTGLSSVGTTSVSLAKCIINTAHTYRFETLFRLGQLSTDVDSFRVVAGMTGNSFNLTATNSIAFRYSGAHNSGKWTCFSNDGAVGGTETDSGVTVAADTDYRLGFEFTGTTITFYINGTLVATHTTNTPATGQGTAYPMLAVTKMGGSTGTTNMIVYSDYLKFRIVR